MYACSLLGAPVGLPDVHDLPPVLDERGEPLPQAVDQLPYAQGELAEHEVSADVGSEDGSAFADGGQHLPAGGELQAPRL